MKNLITLIAVFALTATAYGQVTVGLIDNEDGTGTVTLDGSTASLPCVGIALTADSSDQVGDNVGATMTITAPPSPFFDVYIDFYNTDPNAANDEDFSDDGGHPGADPAGAGALSSGSVVSLSMGELNALDANSQSQPMNIAIIDLGEAGDVCFSEDELRGGIVNIQGGTEVLANDGACFPITDGECFPACHPDYAEWLAVGKPVSWCFPKQCYGDADGMDQSFGRTDMVSVGSNDVTLLLTGYNDIVYVDPTVDPWIAADFDHADQSFGRTDLVRVGSVDVTVLLASYNDLAATVASDCLDCP